MDRYQHTPALEYVLARLVRVGTATDEGAERALGAMRDVPRMEVIKSKLLHYS